MTAISEKCRNAMSQISPCTKVCKINNGGFCVGCKRTLAEIRQWSKMNEIDRKKVMNQLKTRVIE